MNQNAEPSQTPAPPGVSGILRPGPEVRIDSIVDRVHFTFKPTSPHVFAAGHSTHTATVNRGVLRVTPYHRGDDDAVLTGAPIELETTAIYRGDSVVDIGYQGASVDLATGHLRASRAQVVEEFRNYEGGIEQSWRFDAAPGGDGDLVVEVAIVGQNYAGATAGGLHFASPDKLGFRYSNATWIGADGTDIPVAAEYIGGAIRMVVPADILSGTVFPAVLDPTLSAEVAVDTPVQGWTGAGARRAAVAGIGQQFLIVWQDDRGADADIYGARVVQGQVMDPLGIAISQEAGIQDNPTVAFSNGRYVVAWEETGNIRGARVSISSGRSFPLGNIAATDRNEILPRLASRGPTALLVYESNQEVWGSIFNGRTFGPTFDIVSSSEPEGSAVPEKDPTVAGNPNADCQASEGSRRNCPYLVTWSEGATTPDLRGRLVDEAGVPSGDVFDVSAAAGSQLQPSLAFDGQNFFAVFANKNDGVDLYGTRVSPDGAVLDTRSEGMATVGGLPITAAPSSPSQPDVACRALTRDGLASCLVAWTDRRNLTTSGFDIFAQLVNSDYAQTGNSNFTLNGGEIALASFGRDQRRPALAAGSTGWLAAWHDDRHGGGDAIHAARIAASGAITDPDGIMVVTGNNRESAPTVTENAGNWLVAWSDSRAFGADILGLRVRYGGTNQDAAARTISNAVGQQGSPDSVRVGSGNLVTWNDARNGNDDIFAARVEASGALVDPAGIAISTAARDQIFPEVATDGSTSLIVWQDRRGGGFDIFGALLDGEGSVIVADIPICMAAGDQSRPSVAFDPESRLYLVVWSDRRSDPAEILAARVDGTGAVLDPSGQPISSAPGAGYNPDVTFGGGEFFVSWDDRRNGDGDIFAARVTATAAGIQVEDPTGIPVSTAPGDQTDPVAVFAQQSFIVAWTDGRNIGLTSTDIFGAQVAGGAVAGPSFVIASTPETESGAAMSASGGSNPDLVLVAYSRRVSSLRTSRVFYRRLDPRRANGVICHDNGQCESGLCVDGRCCNSACGGNVITDCQACSVPRGAAQDGVCGPVVAGRICRNYEDVFCDRREVCDGVSLDCPEDLGRNEGALCDEACGTVCPANGPGEAHQCPGCTEEGSDLD